MFSFFRCECLTGKRIRSLSPHPNISAPIDLAGSPIFVTIPVSMETDSEAKMVAERKDES